MMWWYGYGPGWIVGWLTMVAFWALVIAGIVVLVKVACAPSARRSVNTPLDVLRRRYAAGELTKEQFDEMKRHVA